MSLLFFVVAFFDPQKDLSLLFVPEPEPTAEEQQEEAAAHEAEVREKLDELVAEGVIDADQVPEDLNLDSPGIHINLGDDEDGENCNMTAEDFADVPAWMQARLTPERMNHICREMQVGGPQFIDNVLDNIPAALIILLPLIAIVLKILYPLSRRYYVEHLLFFVHFHSFFFLILTLQILFARISGAVWIPEPLAILVIVVTSFYVPIYLFKAMRRVYGQGFFVTLIKYIVLLIAYVFGFAAVMLGAAAVAAMAL